MKFKIITTIFYTLCLTVVGYAQNIYVSNDGNNNSPGTKEKPVATLEAARDLIRKYKSINNLPKGGITVCIGKSQYDQTKPFILDENDSGEPDVFNV